MTNFKKMTLASLVALLGFSQIGAAADAADRRVFRAEEKGPRRLFIRTDLRCEIEAFRRNAAGALLPVTNGSTEINLGRLYVRYTVRNAGRGAANGFNSHANAYRNGSKSFTQQQVLNLPPGFSASFPLTKVNSGDSSTIKASLSVDTGKDIPETDEGNNLCKFKVKAQKLH